MTRPGIQDGFLGMLRRSGVLSDTTLHRIQAEHPAADTQPADALAATLVRDGMLTPFQARRLLRGEAQGLLLAGKYRVLDRLGGGGMATVYLCEHARLRRLVAVKMLSAGLDLDPDAVGRFDREARALAAIDHPNVVRAFDVDCNGRHHFLVLEFLDGTDLYRYVAARGPLPPRAAAHYVAQAARGLQQLADGGWVHRDVKPNNLLLDRTGRVKVLDLGLARAAVPDPDGGPLTHHGDGHAILGTVDYIAPEQALDSHAVDGRADVFALGATFYFLLTGRPPFPEGPADTDFAHRRRDPDPIEQVRPDVPVGMARVLGRMMARDPATRYQSPAEVAEALAPWSGDAPPPDPAGMPSWPAAVRRRLDPPKAG
jgi:eukaryotic-like serine/threonine-protein kinase